MTDAPKLCAHALCSDPADGSAYGCRAHMLVLSPEIRQRINTTAGNPGKGSHDHWMALKAADDEWLRQYRAAAETGAPTIQHVQVPAPPVESRGFFLRRIGGLM